MPTGSPSTRNVSGETPTSVRARRARPLLLAALLAGNVDTVRIAVGNQSGGAVVGKSTSRPAIDAFAPPR